MKLIYDGPNKLRRAINNIAGTILVATTILGADIALTHYSTLSHKYCLTKTGHPSADIKTGRSQPTILEKAIQEYGKALLIESDVLNSGLDAVKREIVVGESEYGKALKTGAELYCPMPMSK